MNWIPSQVAFDPLRNICVFNYKQKADAEQDRPEVLVESSATKAGKDYQDKALAKTFAFLATPRNALQFVYLIKSTDIGEWWKC